MHHFPQSQTASSSLCYLLFHRLVFESFFLAIMYILCLLFYTLYWGGGGRVSAVVRALFFNQCGWGLIPELDSICGFSLLVLYTATRGFSLGTPVFPSQQKPSFYLPSNSFDLISFNLLCSLPISRAHTLY